LARRSLVEQSHGRRNRLKTYATDQEVHTLVEETMEELGLLHIQDNLIGSSTSMGISGGERKHTAVAAEIGHATQLVVVGRTYTGLGCNNGASVDGNIEGIDIIGTFHCRCHSSTAHGHFQND
jgi:Fe-S cluster assembly ATPase SufC